MTTSPSQPVFQCNLREQMKEALDRADLVSIVDLSPRINWMGFHARWAADEDYLLRSFHKASEEFLSKDTKNARGLKAWGDYCFAALDAMVTAGYRLLDDPELDQAISKASDQTPVRLKTLHAIALVCAKHELRSDTGETLAHRVVHGTPNKARLSAVLLPGLDLNTPDDEGETPLHALWLKYDYQELQEVGEDLVHIWYDALEILLEHGADPFLKNAHGRTPQDLMENGIIEDLLHGDVKHVKALRGLIEAAQANQQATLLGEAMPAATRPRTKGRL